MTTAPAGFFSGTHRVVSPETTLARVLPLARAMGVTRLAVLTGLDVIGIPVVAAVRPNSRSIAVHQGKGVTLAAAKASALMEAAECFHAEHFSGPLRLATVAEMATAGHTVDLHLLPGPRLGLDERMLWARGTDLLGGGNVWAPHEMVTADYTQPAIERRFAATTNGLASGNVAHEAILHGLYELIERDAVVLFEAEPEAKRVEHGVTLDSVFGPCTELLAACGRAGVALRVWELTTDAGLAVFQCLACPRDPQDPVQPELGWGCHADRDIALSRALTEAAQARLTRISGARDDLAPSTYGAVAKQARRREADRLLAMPAARDFAKVPHRPASSLPAALDHVLARLQAIGCGQAVHVDLSRDDLGIAVARMIVPGLEAPATDQGYAPGARARAAAA